MYRKRKQSNFISLSWPNVVNYTSLLDVNFVLAEFNAAGRKAVFEKAAEVSTTSFLAGQEERQY